MTTTFYFKPHYRSRGGGIATSVGPEDKKGKSALDEMHESVSNVLETNRRVKKKKTGDIILLLRMMDEI
jgi:hypothetical protein